MIFGNNFTFPKNALIAVVNASYPCQSSFDCNPNQTCNTATGVCHDNANICGDGNCTGSENYANCPGDCPRSEGSVCGQISCGDGSVGYTLCDPSCATDNRVCHDTCPTNYNQGCQYSSDCSGCANCGFDSCEGTWRCNEGSCEVINCGTPDPNAPTATPTPTPMCDTGPALVPNKTCSVDANTKTATFNWNWVGDTACSGGSCTGYEGPVGYCTSGNYPSGRDDPGVTIWCGNTCAVSPFYYQIYNTFNSVTLSSGNTGQTTATVSCDTKAQRGRTLRLDVKSHDARGNGSAFTGCTAECPKAECGQSCDDSSQCGTGLTCEGGYASNVGVA